MMVTVEEAKKRWCPMAMQLVHAKQGDELISATSANAGLTDDPMLRPFCISDACMMWRWAQVRNPAYESGIHRREDGSTYSDLVYRPNNPPATVDSETLGFCGLAGSVGA